MSIALFVAFVEVGLLLLYPYISELFVNGSRTFTIPEYLFMCLGADMSKAADRLKNGLGYTESAANAVTYLPLIIIIVLLLCAVIALMTAAAKKSKAAGVIQIIGGTIGAVMTILLSAILNVGEKAMALPSNIVITDKLVLLMVLMIAFGALAVVNPDASIGSKAAGTAPSMMAPAMQRGVYPQVSAAPVRQTVYSAPPVAPVPAAPAPAPAPAAAPASVSATYTCPICSTTQKADLAFCTFCGNPNPNK